MKRVAIAVALVALPAVAQERLPIDAGDVVWIPGGAFTMGASPDDLAYARALCESELELPPRDPGEHEDYDCRDDEVGRDRFAPERPQRRVSVATFGIDRTEVTNAAYRRCVLAGVCAPSAARESGALSAPDHPVVGVSWRDAHVYCAFVGGRVPTEAEWEKAARGDDETRRFPWGRLYDSGAANHGRGPLSPDAIDGFLESAPVGSFPGGASPYGVLDMAGNVWEWTDGEPRPGEFEVELAGARVIRGGSWTSASTTVRVTARSLQVTDARTSDLGIRCVYDL
jgi:formylglycine-generating enzyme required for sulfatase activity